MLGKEYRAVLGYMPQQGLYDDFTLDRFYGICQH